MAIVRDHTFAISELDLQDFTVAKLDLAILTVKVLKMKICVFLANLSCDQKC